ncbi:MAG: flagellar basal body P-ring formation chaperone FlgA [Planctomycetota bacterium]
MTKAVERFLRFLLPVLAAAPMAAAGDAGVTLRPEAGTPRAFVRLSDVADISGEGAETLEFIYVGRAPRAGETIVFTRETIAAQVRRQAGAGVTVGGAEAVRIRRLGAGPDEAAVVEAVRAHVTEKEHLDQVTVTLEPGTSLPGEIPAGARFVVTGPDRNLAGTVKFSIEARTDAGVAEAFEVAARVAGMRTVVRAKRNLGRHEIIGPEDVAVERIENSPVARQALGRVEDAIGRRVKAYIRQGSLVIAGTVEILPVVRRGDFVRVVSRFGSVAITVKGVAREDGAPGAVISVENPDSNKVFPARVTGPGAVETAD